MAFPFATIANLLGVDLPPELLAQLPSLLAKIPNVIDDAEHFVTTVSDRAAAMEETLARIEKKLDVLGKAVIMLMEQKENVDAAIPGSNTDTTALALTNGNSNEHD